MTVFTFVGDPSTGTDYWDQPAIWSGGVVPNGPGADVVIPTITLTATGQVYPSSIAIQAFEGYSINSLSLANNTLEVEGPTGLTISQGMVMLAGGELIMSGQLSAGSLVLDGGGFLGVAGGLVQGAGQIDVSGALINNSTILGEGLVIDVGSLTNNSALEADGQLTINDSGAFTNLSNGTLTGGLYTSVGIGGALDLNVGGVVTTDAAFITLTGPSSINFYDPGAGAYVSLLSTLQTIAPSGDLGLNGLPSVSTTFDSGALTVDGSLSLSQVTLNSTQLTIDPGGGISAFGSKVGAPVVDDGGIWVQAGDSGVAVLDLTGPTTGTGALYIGAGTPPNPGPPASALVIATLDLGGPVSTLVEFGNNIGVLQLDAPTAFTGAIEPGGAGDQIILSGISFSSVTSYSYSATPTGGTLTIIDGGAPVSLKFVGDYTAGSFTLSAGPQALSSSPPSLLITVGDSKAALTAAFTNVLIGAPDSAFATSPTITLADGLTVPNPMYQDAQSLPYLESQVDGASQFGTNQTAMAQALNTIEHYADATTSVATLAYEFFTGATPNLGGYGYLVNGTANPNDLNSAYYARFTLPDRYIDFAVNLGKYGAGATGFNAAYGSLSLADAFAKAYDSIFGFAPAAGKVTAILDAVVGPNGETRADYFATYGGDGLNGIGTKAAAVGWLMSIAVRDDLGVYAAANDAFLSSLAHGAGQYNVDLLSAYPDVTAAQAAAMVPYGIANLEHPLTVVDTGANIANNLDALQALAAGHALAGITLSDASRPTLSISDAQLTADALVLGDISGPHSLFVNSVTAADAAAVQANSAVTFFTLSDTTAHFSAALDALEADDKLAGVMLTDSGLITLGAVQLVSDAHALGFFNIGAGGPALSVTGTAAQFNGANVTGMTEGGNIDVTDLNASAISATFVQGGSGGQLSLSDGVHTTTVSLLGQFAPANFSGSAAAAGFIFTPEGAFGTEITWHH